VDLTLSLDIGSSAGGDSHMTGQIKLSSALLTFAAAVLASTLFLSGCNTAEGIGDDVEEAGDEVEDAVD
jgi:predicted small secreted protein